VRVQDIQSVVDLLKLAKIGLEEKKEREENELEALDAVEFNLPENLNGVKPLISVDGSYAFLFSFLGAETWIVMFRIATTEYKIEIKNGEIHYCMNASPKVYDHLNVISFNEIILASQPKVYSKTADIASNFEGRRSNIFASNIMSYLEDLTLDKISKTRKNCILLKDGALLTFKALERESIYRNILSNCRENNIMFAGVSKSTSTHLLNDFYTDDYFLKKYYDKKYANLTYVPIPEELIKKQTKFDIWGDVHFAKLHKEALKWFRVDIAKEMDYKDDLFSSIAAYSMIKLIPGYPIGLIETHKVAKSVRDFKESYLLELLESFKKLGMDFKDILDGAVDIDGRQYRSFHEILDQI